MIDKHSTIEEEKGLGANKHPKLPAKRWEVCRTPTTIVDQFLFYECCESPPLDAQKNHQKTHEKKQAGSQGLTILWVYNP